MIPDINQDLLTKAFTHRSYLNENGNGSFESNERLEYLGDAVLELAVSEFLYKKFADKPEGELTSLRAALVKTTTLAQVASKLNLGEKLLMSKGEEQTGGRQNQSLLANTFEAVIGAIYLDSGFSQVVEFLNQNLFGYVDEIVANNLHRDFKSSFQEKVQAMSQPTPTYKVVEEEGPDHVKTFTVALYVGEREISRGTGKSKQQAQQEAAKKGLDQLEAGTILW